MPITRSSDSALVVAALPSSEKNELPLLIARHLNCALAAVKRVTFGNGEVSLKVEGSELRGRSAILVLNSFTADTLHTQLFSFLVLVRECKLALASRITAVIPYLCYSRQDRKEPGKHCVAMRLVADLLETAGIDRLITLDLHSSQIEGFFSIPVVNVQPEAEIIEYIQTLGLDKTPLVIVAPDSGAIKRAKAFAVRLSCNFCVIHKERNTNNVIEEMRLIGTVAGHAAIIVDDIADSCGTVFQATLTLLQSGAVSVHAIVTHGIFSGSALEKLASYQIQSVAAANSLVVADNCNVHFIDVSKALAAEIKQ